MSARELTDTYQYVVIGYRMQGKHARYEARHLEATGAQAACQKVHAEGLEVVAAIRGTNMTSPVLCSVIHEPFAQPHVAAGRGWRERINAAVLEYGQCENEPYFFKRIEMRRQRAFAIHDLLDEVVELPEPNADALSAVRKQGNEVKFFLRGTSLLFTKEDALQIAAALIRAATSAEDKASQ